MLTSINPSNQRRDWASGIPVWPRLTMEAGGHVCTVSGRHIAPNQILLSNRLARWIVVAMLMWMPWHFWGFHNLPDFVRENVNAVAARLGYRIFTFEQRRWVYAGLYVVLWSLAPVWRWLLCFVLQLLLWKRTTVRFSAQHVFKRHFMRWRAYDRALVQPVTFLLQQHPDLAWLELMARQRSADWRTIFHQQERHLFLQYGPELVPIARFASARDAERFLHICLFALSLRLKIAPAVSTGVAHPPFQGASHADI